MTIDPIALMTQQINTKRAAAIAAGKTVVTDNSTTKNKTTANITTKTPDIYSGKRPDVFVPTARMRYLQSIDSSLIKKAAQQLGLDVKFGLDPEKNDWKSRNPELVAEWDKITQIMADLKASKSATASISTDISSN